MTEASLMPLEAQGIQFLGGGQVATGPGVALTVSRSGVAK